MKKILATLALLCLGTTAASAQIRSASGDKALQFSIGNNFSPSGITFGSLGTTGIGGKYFFGNRFAGTAAFGFQTGGSPSSTRLMLMPGIQYNVVQSSSVALYLGGKLGIGTVSGDGAGNSGTEFGIGGIIGAEWFPSRDISFSAEYTGFGIGIFSPKVGDSQTFIGLGQWAGLTASFYF